MILHEANIQGGEGVHGHPDPIYFYVHTTKTLTEVPPMYSIMLDYTQ